MPGAVSPTRFEIRVAALTDVGLQRTRNEDALLVDEARGIFAVADGMGGHPAGDVASQLGVRALAEALADPAADEAAMRAAFAAASKAIIEHGRAIPADATLGTTLTALVLAPVPLFGHVGDSRLYRLRDGGLHQLTTDHTWVHERVKAGLLPPEAERTHPWANVLTRVLGMDPPRTVDTGEVELRVGDRLLLTTDGMPRLLEDRTITELLTEHDDGQRAAQALIDAANAAGGVDNSTVIVLDIAGGG